MGLQLIFVVETDKKCKSDWIYIKETIEKFFIINSAKTKLSPVYLGGKRKYATKAIKNEINKLKNQFQSTSEDNQSKVILCLDCDNYDNSYEDKEFLDNAKCYCIDNNMDLVWFCKDIESVYLGNKVNDSEKKEKAAKFKSKKMIENIESDKLSKESYARNTSNIMNIVERYLDRKN